MNPQQRAWETRRITHAISVRQPYAELIIRGVKVHEYRSRPTNIRGRVYIYASKNTGRVEDYEQHGLDRNSLITGKLIGTVEVIACEPSGHEFAYVMANPRRLTKPVEPENHPQPCWFRPFADANTHA
jgi:hypothetical protein